MSQRCDSRSTVKTPQGKYFTESPDNETKMNNAPHKKTFKSPRPININKKTLNFSETLIDNHRSGSLIHALNCEDNDDTRTNSMPSINGFNVTLASPDPYSKHFVPHQNEDRYVRDDLPVPSRPLFEDANMKNTSVLKTLPNINGYNVDIKSPDPLSKFNNNNNEKSSYKTVIYNAYQRFSHVHDSPSIDSSRMQSNFNSSIRKSAPSVPKTSPDSIAALSDSPTILHSFQSFCTTPKKKFNVLNKESSNKLFSEESSGSPPPARTGGGSQSEKIHNMNMHPTGDNLHVVHKVSAPTSMRSTGRKNFHMFKVVT